MDLVKFTYKHVTFPLLDKIRRINSLEYLRSLERSQWFPPSQIEEMQMRKLSALLNHAYNNVPYYHRTFKERGLRPEDIKKISDITKLPILTKESIRKNATDLLAVDFKRYKPKVFVSSGSTGKPLKYYIDASSHTAFVASRWRSWKWAGYEFGDKYASLAGLALVPAQITLSKRIYEHFLLRNLPLSGMNMNEQNMAKYVEKLKHFKPQFILGYPSTLYIFAKYLKNNGVYIKFNAVMTTGETLFKHQRELIEEQFNCKVFDMYGCHDGNQYAAECSEHSGYHMSSEIAITEFVKDGEHVSFGERGEIISTDLHNYSMPFIRYSVGDVGIPSDELCNCGRKLPIMSSIEGRVMDFITFGDGTKISGHTLSIMFTDLGIEQYQVIQEAKDRLLIKIVKGANYSKKDLDQIVNTILRSTSENVDIEIVYVDSIPTTKAGKRQYIISKVSANSV